LFNLEIPTIFAALKWMRLAEALGMPFHYHSPRRLSGDLKWKAEFENILKEQVISDVIPLWTRILNI
jgi:hypothetical protein